MANELETRPEEGIMELLGGIITDVQVLLKQQLALFRHEIRGEVGQAGEAGSFVAAGMLVLVVAGVALSGMLVHLLARLAPSVPLWGCYGIVGVIIAGVGVILCLAGMQKFRHVKIPAAEANRELKETLNG